MINISTIFGSGSQELRKYILSNPSTLVYSEPRFLKLISDHLGARCGWIVAKREEKISGLLPFIFQEGPLGPVFNSLAYYGSNGGVIQEVNDNETKVMLIEEFYRIAFDANAVSATIISNPLEVDSDLYDQYTCYDYRDERIGQITHMPNNKDDLLLQFDNPRPRNIRKALKEGVCISKGQTHSLEFLYNTHIENMKSIGGLAKSRDFFDMIPSCMHPADWMVFTASLFDRPIAALLVFYCNKTVEYFCPVILENYRNTQALALLIYEAMSDAIYKGYTNWNWGGTWLSQGGVYEFKKRWGTSEYRYYYYTRIFNSDVRKSSSDYLLKEYRGFYVIPFSQLIST